MTREYTDAAKQALAEAGKPHKSPAVQEYEERFALSIGVGELEAEVDRLRAALENLARDPPATLDEPDPNWEVIGKMRAIARAALKDTTS